MSDTDDDASKVGAAAAAALAADGVAVVKGFASGEECSSLMSRMATLIEEWTPLQARGAVFRTDEAQRTTSDYFLDSADRVHFFMEPGAVDGTTGGLRADVSKQEALNKVGHGLHVADAAFAEYAFSPKVVSLVTALGYADPVLPQSMYIFKQPGIGGEVTSHQDATFLNTTPRQSVLGLWLALQDATLENGCVWARPGSHREPLRRAFRRNPAHFGDVAAGVAADRSAPQMLFEHVDGSGEHAGARDAVRGGGGGVEAGGVSGATDAWAWEGRMPGGKGLSVEAGAAAARAAGFVPLTCAAGDLVLIHGTVEHLSLANTSTQSRHTFQLHLVEGPAAGVTWSRRNWLQYGDAAQRRSFPRLAVDGAAVLAALARDAE